MGECFSSMRRPRCHRYAMSPKCFGSPTETTVSEVKLNDKFTIHIVYDCDSHLEHFCVYPSATGHTILLQGYSKEAVQKLIRHWKNMDH